MNKAYYRKNIGCHCRQVSFKTGLTVMAYLHFRTRTQVQIPNLMATLYYAEHFHIACTQILIHIQTQMPKHYRIHFWDRYPYPDLDPNPCPPIYISHYTFVSGGIRFRQKCMYFKTCHEHANPFSLHFMYNNSGGSGGARDTRPLSDQCFSFSCSFR